MPNSSRFFSVLLSALFLASLAGPASAHVVPPEKLHPVAEAHRRLAFLLELNPVRWDTAAVDLETIADGFDAIDPAAAAGWRAEIRARLEPFLTPAADPEAAPGAAERRAATRELFEGATRAVAAMVAGQLAAASENLADGRSAVAELEAARLAWAAFEPDVRATDPKAFAELGLAWLEMANALGNQGFLGAGAVAPRPETFAAAAASVRAYLERSFGPGFVAPAKRFAALPAHSPTFDAKAPIPWRLPPGSEVNKQLPRPRQVLNMGQRGVDEAETNLIALGDMAFDSPMIFGDPARSLTVSCNTCHNKSITNPSFFIPGLSVRPGGVDVSNSFFAPHANNGHFDPLDVPDLRGLRFTAPYGRNGRIASLREFTRNVIVNEFNGAEPDPLLLDGMVAYMVEFDFLPNPLLTADGTLTKEATAAAKRGEAIFNRPFAGLGNRACSTCHVPSDHFLDRKRHDLGHVGGATKHARDGALDTPTLLSSRYTAPYLHDGSLPTLGAVSEWFNERFSLGLSSAERADLTSYLEAVGEGLEAYEDTVFTLDAELEEFSFFLSTYEFLVERGKSELLATTFETVAFEIRAHKWDVQDLANLPVLDQLADLMDAALAAERRGERDVVDARVAQYRQLYDEHVDVLR